MTPSVGFPQRAKGTVTFLSANAGNEETEQLLQIKKGRIHKDDEMGIDQRF